MHSCDLQIIVITAISDQREPKRLFFSSFDFFFLGGLRIQRLCFDAFSAPGLQSNFRVELRSERRLYLEPGICKWE